MKYFDKLLNKLFNIFNNFFIDKHSRRFIESNKKHFPDLGERTDRIILADFHDIAQSHILYSYITNALALKYSARISTFGLSEIRYFLKRRVRLVYRSCNCSDFVLIKSHDNIRLGELLTSALLQIKSKQDLIDLSIEGIGLGIDVYESYLRRYNRPTVDIKDPRLVQLLKEAIIHLLFWENYLQSKNVAAVVISHDNYIDLNILSKVARCRSVPVYVATTQLTVKVDSDFSYANKFFKYKEWFSMLSSEKQNLALMQSKEKLSRRFSGEVGVDMFYATKSAFAEVSNTRLIAESEKVKVLICSHCFFDNPHAYGKLFFPDFYEWLMYLKEVAEKTDYDWYLKTHPDPLPGTHSTIDEILGSGSKIKILPIEASNLQIAKEGIDIVLTAYGSVGHEYPLLGIPVINAGINPHISYSFNYHPSDLSDYSRYLYDLRRIKDEKYKISNEEVYQFYYMHHDFSNSDDSTFDSYNSMINEIGYYNSSLPIVYDKFLNELVGAKHSNLVTKFEKYIESNEKYCFYQKIRTV